LRIGAEARIADRIEVWRAQFETAQKEGEDLAQRRKGAEK